MICWRHLERNVSLRKTILIVWRFNDKPHPAARQCAGTPTICFARKQRHIQGIFPAKSFAGDGCCLRRAVSCGKAAVKRLREVSAAIPAAYGSPHSVQSRVCRNAARTAKRPGPLAVLVWYSEGSGSFYSNAGAGKTQGYEILRERRRLPLPAGRLWAAQQSGRQRGPDSLP